MIYVTCYFLIIDTEIQFNHTNSAIHSSGHSRGPFTSISDYASAQWRLVLHILVTCSPYVNKCLVTRAMYGIRCDWNHWPITKTCGPSEHLLCHDGHIRQEVKRPRECSEALGIFLNGLKNICKFWSLIKTHDLLVCNIIKMVPYNGCSQMLHISLKNLLSPTPVARCPLMALRSILLMAGEPRPRYSALQLLGESGACGRKYWGLGKKALRSGWYFLTNRNGIDSW